MTILYILGSYDVILDEKHYRDILMQHVIPPAAQVGQSHESVG